MTLTDQPTQLEDMPPFGDKPLTAVQAVAAVMGDVHGVRKSNTANAGGTYKYRGIDDVINALAGPMRTHGLVLVPHVVSAEVEPMIGRQGWTNTLMTVEYDVVGPDGSTLPRPVRAFAIGSDNSDKGPGKAMSYAFKSAISQLFCIPTDDPRMDNEHANIPEPEPLVTPKQVGDLARLINGVADEDARAKVAKSWKQQFGDPTHLLAKNFDAAYAAAMDAVESVTA